MIKKIIKFVLKTFWRKAIRSTQKFLLKMNKIEFLRSSKIIGNTSLLSFNIESQKTEIFRWFMTKMVNLTLKLIQSLIKKTIRNPIVQADDVIDALYEIHNEGWCHVESKKTIYQIFLKYSRTPKDWVHCYIDNCGIRRLKATKKFQEAHMPTRSTELKRFKIDLIDMSLIRYCVM